MKHYLVLVDFTPTAKIAIEQSIKLGLTKNAKISICHILESDHESLDEMKDHFQSYVDQISAAGLECDIVVERGKLFSKAKEIVERISPDLIIVGTHGKQGIRQNLFGSAIHKLVVTLNAPSLVVNDHTMVMDGGFKRILVPISPHADFLKKIEDAYSVLNENGKIYLFAIIKPGVDLDEDLRKNLDAAQDKLNEIKVDWEYIEADSSLASVGYSLDTLKFVEEEEMDLVSIIADVSKQNAHFGKMDKENLLLNKLGLPILCSN